MTVTGIDPASWQLTLLPLPKGFSRGAALGFCGGHAVGRAEKLRGGTVGCWWQDGKPQLLTLPGHDELAAGHARGATIPGHWRTRATGAMGAVAWTLRNGALSGQALHDAAHGNTWATATGGSAVVGIGSPPRGRKVGLVWRNGAKPELVQADGDVALYVTDGTRLGGSVSGRATFWASAAAQPVDLNPPGCSMSAVQAIDGAQQIGQAWSGMCPRAALWEGTAASFRDLTPDGFEAGGALDGTHGFQVGFVRARDTTPNGSSGSDNRAVVWQGGAGRWFDLNALLPAGKYNASLASAVEVRGDAVLISGEASRYESMHPGTPQETHTVPVAHPVLWSARLT